MNLCVSKYSTTSKGKGHEEWEKTSPQGMGKEMDEGNHSTQHLGCGSSNMLFFFCPQGGADSSAHRKQTE